MDELVLILPEKLGMDLGLDLAENLTD